MLHAMTIMGHCHYMGIFLNEAPVSFISLYITGIR